MKCINQVRLYRYATPCTAIRSVGPLREGLLLNIVSDTGHEGWGEIAPLPGFSKETLEEAENSSVELAGLMRGSQILETSGEASEWVESLSVLPSVRFGFSAALSILAARESDTGLAVSLNTGAATHVQICALLAGSTSSLIVAVQSLKSEGYLSFKLKVGAGCPGDDITRVRLVREAIGPDAGLRLDANRAWSLDDANEVLSSVRDTCPEYVEEPLADADRLGELAARTGISQAGDESIVSFLRLFNHLEPGRLIQEIAEKSQSTGIRFAVLKPMLLGSLSFVLRLSESLSQRNIVPVLSSSFETAIGLSALVSLASAGPEFHHHSAGLDTLRYMPSGLTDHSEIFTRPQIEVAGAERFTVHTEGLERVEL
jgi:o-succinylbenzoate synthase